MRRELTDAAKVIAAIAVVGIHATSQSENRFAGHHDYLSLDFLSVLVNQWARFSVPLFLYLSAYGLAQGARLGYLAFLQKRLPAILIPYFIFSAIPLAMDFRNQSLAGVTRKLLTGTADYHLYFLVILAQCYLLFPLLLRFFDYSARAYAWITWALFGCVVLLLYKTTSEITLGALGLPHPGWHASFCIYWLPYFMLGLLHAKREHSPRHWFWAIAAFALVLFDYLYYSRLGTPVDYYNHFSRPSVALYAVAVIYALPKFEAGKLATLAPLTFVVYLIHPQILRLLNWIAPTLPTILVWILTAALAFLAARSWQALKFSRKSA